MDTRGISNSFSSLLTSLQRISSGRNSESPEPRPPYGIPAVTSSNAPKNTNTNSSKNNSHFPKSAAAAVNLTFNNAPQHIITYTNPEQQLSTGQTIPKQPAAPQPVELVQSVPKTEVVTQASPSVALVPLTDNNVAQHTPSSSSGTSPKKNNHSLSSAAAALTHHEVNPPGGILVPSLSLSTSHLTAEQRQQLRPIATPSLVIPAERIISSKSNPSANTSLQLVPPQHHPSVINRTTVETESSVTALAFVAPTHLQQSSKNNHHNPTGERQEEPQRETEAADPEREAASAVAPPPLSLAYDSPDYFHSSKPNAAHQPTTYSIPLQNSASRPQLSLPQSSEASFSAILASIQAKRKAQQREDQQISKQQSLPPDAHSTLEPTLRMPGTDPHVEPSHSLGTHATSVVELSDSDIIMHQQPSKSTIRQMASNLRQEPQGSGRSHHSDKHRRYESHNNGGYGRQGPNDDEDSWRNPSATASSYREGRSRQAPPPQKKQKQKLYHHSKEHGSKSSKTSTVKVTRHARSAKERDREQERETELNSHHHRVWISETHDHSLSSERADSAPQGRQWSQESTSSMSLSDQIIMHWLPPEQEKKLYQKRKKRDKKEKLKQQIQKHMQQHYGVPNPNAHTDASSLVMESGRGVPPPLQQMIKKKSSYPINPTENSIRMEDGNALLQNLYSSPRSTTLQTPIRSPSFYARYNVDPNSPVMSGMGLENSPLSTARPGMGGVSGPSFMNPLVMSSPLHSSRGGMGESGVVPMMSGRGGWRGVRDGDYPPGVSPLPTARPAGLAGAGYDGSDGLEFGGEVGRSAMRPFPGNTGAGVEGPPLHASSMLGLGQSSGGLRSTNPDGVFNALGLGDGDTSGNLNNILAGRNLNPTSVGERSLGLGGGFSEPNALNGGQNVMQHLITDPSTFTKPVVWLFGDSVEGTTTSSSSSSTPVVSAGPAAAPMAVAAGPKMDFRLLRELQRLREMFQKMQQEMLQIRGQMQQSLDEYHRQVEVLLNESISSDSIPAPAPAPLKPKKQRRLLSPIQIDLPPPPKVNLDPILERIEELQQQAAKLKADADAIPPAVPSGETPPYDLSSLQDVTKQMNEELVTWLKVSMDELRSDLLEMVGAKLVENTAHMETFISQHKDGFEITETGRDSMASSNASVASRLSFSTTSNGISSSASSLIAKCQEEMRRSVEDVTRSLEDALRVVLRENEKEREEERREQQQAIARAVQNAQAEAEQAEEARRTMEKQDYQNSTELGSKLELLFQQVQEEVFMVMNVSTPQSVLNSEGWQAEMEKVLSTIVDESKQTSMFLLERFSQYMVGAQAKRCERERMAEQAIFETTEEIEQRRHEHRMQMQSLVELIHRHGEAASEIALTFERRAAEVVDGADVASSTTMRKVQEVALINSSRLREIQQQLARQRETALELVQRHAERLIRPLETAERDQMEDTAVLDRVLLTVEKMAEMARQKVEAPGPSLAPLSNVMPGSSVGFSGAVHPTVQLHALPSPRGPTAPLTPGSAFPANKTSNSVNTFNNVATTSDRSNVNHSTIRRKKHVIHHTAAPPGPTPYLMPPPLMCYPTPPPPGPPPESKEEPEEIRMLQADINATKDRIKDIRRRKRQGKVQALQQRQREIAEREHQLQELQQQLHHAEKEAAATEKARFQLQRTLASQVREIQRKHQGEQEDLQRRLEQQQRVYHKEQEQRQQAHRSALAQYENDRRHKEEEGNAALAEVQQLQAALAARQQQHRSEEEAAAVALAAVEQRKALLVVQLRREVDVLRERVQTSQQRKVAASAQSKAAQTAARRQQEQMEHVLAAIAQKLKEVQRRTERAAVSTAHAIASARQAQEDAAMETAEVLQSALLKEQRLQRQLLDSARGLHSPQPSLLAETEENAHVSALLGLQELKHRKERLEDHLENQFLHLAEHREVLESARSASSANGILTLSPHTANSSFFHAAAAPVLPHAPLMIAPLPLQTMVAAPTPLTVLPSHTPFVSMATEAPAERRRSRTAEPLPAVQSQSSGGGHSGGRLTPPSSVVSGTLACHHPTAQQPMSGSRESVVRTPVQFEKSLHSGGGSSPAQEQIGSTQSLYAHASLSRQSSSQGIGDVVVSSSGVEPARSPSAASRRPSQSCRAPSATSIRGSYPRG